MGVGPFGEHALRCASIDLRDHAVRRRIDHRDLIRVVLCHVQPTLGRVEREAERVPFELDAFDEVASRRRADVDCNYLAIAIRRYVGDPVALDDHRERERAADAANLTFIAGEERAQVVLIAHRRGVGVDDADRVIVVVHDYERLAVAR